MCLYQTDGPYVDPSWFSTITVSPLTGKTVIHADALELPRT